MPVNLLALDRNECPASFNVPAVSGKMIRELNVSKFLRNFGE